MLYKIGYNAIAPQSEATLIKQNDYEKLSNRFSNIVILFDNDSAGVEGAKKLSEAFNIPYFILPQGTKDCSDYVEKYSSEQLLNYIEKCLQNIKSLSLNGKVSM
jgi:DNA primase